MGRSSDFRADLIQPRVVVHELKSGRDSVAGNGVPLAYIRGRRAPIL